MQTLLIAVGSGIAFLIAYHTYGRWLGRRIFRLSAEAVCPSVKLRDDRDYVPTQRSVVFGHHFTSIAGTGPIVGPAIAVMWGWLPALLWVVFGSIFIGAVHDFGSLVVSLRNNGQSVGDIAGRLLNRRVRLLFLFVLFLALTIIIAIFGLVIASVFRQYPPTIIPCFIQIPIAIAIGAVLHRRGVNLLVPSIIALALMYLTVIYGDVGILGRWNHAMSQWPAIVWVGVLLVYSYIASVLPVWILLQPRDYINSLQLISALGLIVIGLFVAALMGGAATPEGVKPELVIEAPAWDFSPTDAPAIFPFLFITIACGAISGFHCLVSSGTSSKQLKNESDARFVGYGAMLTEGFLAVLVICACVAGLGLGAVVSEKDGMLSLRTAGGQVLSLDAADPKAALADSGITPEEAAAISVTGTGEGASAVVRGKGAWNTRYASWTSAGDLGAKVAAFVDGAANFLTAMGIPITVALALMGVLVASFAGTTLDTACRLQRYVIQELAASLSFAPPKRTCEHCGADVALNVSGVCPACGVELAGGRRHAPQSPINPLRWLRNPHGATVTAVIIAGVIAALPRPGAPTWDLTTAGTGGLILWPMFGATNQLMGGLAFLVIAFYLWRRRLPVWFLVLPMIFMLIMPAWAMSLQLHQWLTGAAPNWPLIALAVATVLLEIWMIVEAVLLFPKVRGVLEPSIDAAPAQT